VPLGHPGSALPAGVSTPGELERAAAFADPLARHRFLAGRLALRAHVAELLGVPPGLVIPTYTCPDCGPGEHGVPGFALTASGSVAATARGIRAAYDGERPLPLPVAASMSRAGGWVLLAAELPSDKGDAGVGEAPIRRRARLGVDLARIADLRDAIPDAAFSAAERRRVCAADDPAAEAATLWARKEALLKALGTGLRGDPSAVETVGDPRVSDLDPGRCGLPAGFAAAIARA
jgi:4'-phosphopantetheinyl transferase